MRVFIDLDGVVADMMAGAVKHFCRESPYNGSIVGEEAWDICRLWDITADDFWGSLDFNFWAGLPKTPEADTIMLLLRDAFGDSNLCFLSSPTGVPGCADGKIVWAQAHYPYVPLLLAKASRRGDTPKHLLATDNSLLIDDCEANARNFSAHGGRTFLFPRPWNSLYAQEPSAVRHLACFVKALIQKEVTV